MGVVFLAAALSIPLALGAEEASPETARLRIRVASVHGEAPTAPYVAVVAETAAWSEPAREAVLEAGEVAVWELPPGRYRVVAGAPGYTLEYRPVFELAATEAHTESIDLAPLVPVEGRVTVEGGGPLTGALVSDLRQLVLGFAKRLSPLGEAHLRGNFEGVSDHKGAFRVLLHPAAGHYLAVQAEGRAPRFFENLRTGAARAVLGEVALGPGASLEVAWPEAGRDPVPYDRLQLVPSGRAFPEGLGLPGVLAIWARPVGGPSRPNEARWPSLPPGRYELWLKAPPRGGHDLVPLRLTEVDLPAGNAVEIEVELAGGSTNAAAEERRDRDRPSIELLTPPLPADDLESLRIFAWRNGIPAQAEFSATAVSGGLLLKIEGGCRADGVLVLESESRVGAVPLDSPAGCPEVRRVELFPRADVAVTVGAPPGAELPKWALATVSPCVAIPGEPLMVLPAEVSANGTLALPVRADCVDLTAKIGDFAPLAWRGLELKPGETRDLGSHRLRHGAALLVRVLSGADGRPLDGVAVNVVERQRVTGILDGEAETNAGAGAAVTRDGGWARLYGLPPGQELVVLLQGESRRLPHPAAELELAAGEERILDALELPPPTELTVEVELSRELEEIEAVPYQVYFRKADPDGLDLRVSREIGPDGVVRFGEVPAGRWRLEGIARAGDGKPFPAGSAELDLSPGEHRIFTLELADSLYRGRITYEGLPVEGSMTVTPVTPADRRGMSVRLSTDGEFRLPLEGPGTYTVQVYDARDDRFSDAVIPEVSFEDPGDEVRIRVPEGRLAGHVISAGGEPIPEARIELRSRQGLTGDRFLEARRFQEADGAGDFAVEALTPGAWTVSARAGRLESEPRVIRLAPDERVEGFELVLEPADLVTGSVYDASGKPVGGARLLITPRPKSAAELVSVVRGVTDSRGRFELSTSHEDRIANLQVVTPEGAAAAFSIRLQPDMVVELPPMGGALLLELPCVDRRAWVSGVYFLVDPKGAYLPVPTLGSAERSSEGSCGLLRKIPGVGAGSWRIVQVRSPAEDALLMTGQGHLLENLGEVVSRPGADLRVNLKPEAPDAADAKNGKGRQR